MCQLKNIVVEKQIQSCQFLVLPRRVLGKKRKKTLLPIMLFKK